MPSPSLFSRSIAIGELSFPTYRFVLIVIGLVIAIGLWLFQSKTRIGAIIRAGMDDKEMTMGLGINYKLVCSMVFMLGAFISGFAGVIGAPLLGANLGLGMNILQFALIVVILGGVGTVQGAFLGAMIIGLVDAFGKAFFPVFAMFSIYIVLVIIFLLRPSGLLGRRI